MGFTARGAAAELQSIRDDLASMSSEPREVLLARCDAVGRWAAMQKHSKSIGRILEECHRLADKLQGGSGRGGVRIDYRPIGQNYAPFEGGGDDVGDDAGDGTDVESELWQVYHDMFNILHMPGHSEARRDYLQTALEALQQAIEVEGVSD